LSWVATGVAWGGLLEGVPNAPPHHYIDNIFDNILKSSWQHRCCSAGLQKNLGKTWGPAVWETMAGHSANQVFVDAAEFSAKKVEKDLRENQQQSKYSQ
jgi:hypothetical protein